MVYPIRSDISAEWALNKVQTAACHPEPLSIVSRRLRRHHSDKIGRRNTSIFHCGLFTADVRSILTASDSSFIRVWPIGLVLYPVVTTIFSESTPTARRALFITSDGLDWSSDGAWRTDTELLVRYYGWRSAI